MLGIRQSGLAWAAPNAGVATFAVGAVAHAVAGPASTVATAGCLGIGLGLARRNAVSVATLGGCGLGSAWLYMAVRGTAFETPLFVFVALWSACYFCSCVRQSWLDGLAKAEHGEKVRRAHERSILVRFHLAMREVEDQTLVVQTADRKVECPRRGLVAEELSESGPSATSCRDRSLSK